MSDYKSDVMKLAAQYRKSGMDMSEAVKKAYKDIDKSLYDMGESAEDAGDKAEKSGNKFKGFGEKLSGLSGKLKTFAKAGAGAAGAALVALGKKAVESYAEYEQLVGGVETLFGKSAGRVEEYASQAYKTAGLSANQYMETVTSFSASLLQSLGGDTEKAADYADKAVTDMADNANKMGTSMESIQNAYQGFAKQNYTMLDNLKLGYGGTKQEMERLITDAEGLDSSFKASRDSNGKLTMSYADIVDAIHIVQDEMGITGTTSKEASETISGSIASMKAAFSNFVTGLADDNADIEQLTEDLVDSIGTVAKNLLPVIGQVLKTLGKMILDGIDNAASGAYNALDNALNNLAKRISNWFKGRISDLKSTLSQLKSNAKAALSDFIATVSRAKERIIAPFRTAKDKIKGFISDIKSFFSNLHLELPHIKLPHFKITGGKAPWGLGGQGEKPSIGIDWYAKAMNNAMLLNSPTIFGMSGGKFLGGGEAGQEVVAGSGTLMGMIKDAVRSEQSITERLLAQILSAILASDANLAERIAEGVDGLSIGWSDREFKRAVNKAVGYV